MRLAHVVTLLDANNTFGGPASVAASQARELSRLGHQVEVIAGTPDRRASSLHREGVTWSLFPTRHLPGTPTYAGMLSPGAVRYLARHVHRFDVVHVHVARDLFVLPLALISALVGRRNLVLQPHGMITPDPRLAVRLTDTVASRAVFRRAPHVLALSQDELHALRTLFGDTPEYSILRNPVTVPHAPIERPLPGSPYQILFCGRLHATKRVEVFLEAARLLINAGLNARFTIVGPDQGSRRLMDDCIDKLSLRHYVDYVGEMRRNRVLDYMRASDVLLQTSLNESFGMTIAEALSVGTPVILNETYPIAPELQAASAARACDGTPSGYAAATLALFSDGAWQQMSAAGQEWVRKNLSPDIITRRLIAVYETFLPHASSQQHP